MIKLENTKVVGWEPAIRGMRNPKNSWAKSDSVFDIRQDMGDYSYSGHDISGKNWDAVYSPKGYILGVADHNLMTTLAAGGPVHAKYRRMIVVYVDITAPLYWWKEFDTYKVGTVANSCSTMHKIQDKEFTFEDFSCEHLEPEDGETMDFKWPGDVQTTSKFILRLVIMALNFYRNRYNLMTRRLKDETLTDSERKHFLSKQKHYWWQMIQLLPTSYNQKRTVMLNYEVLAGIYPMRKNHKLDEWHTFCDWIKELPHSELIIGQEETEKEPSEEQPVTYGMIFNDFKEKYPEYVKHIVDYRPSNQAMSIKIWLNVANAVTGSSTITYDYRAKRISL